MLIGKPLINIPETSNPVNLFTILQILTIYIETYTDTNSQTRKLTLFTGDKIWSLLLAHIEKELVNNLIRLELIKSLSTTFIR